MFFLSGFLGNLYSIYQLQDSSSYLLGASGAVSGLLGVWLMLYPRHQISIIIPIGLYIEKAKIPIKNELIKKLNFELAETIKTANDKKIFHFCSLESRYLESPNKYKENTTADEQIWNNWGFAVDDKNNIIGEVNANKR